MAGAGVYIHIPFCQARCSYCDFNTYAGLNHLIDDYVAALCDEIRGGDSHPNPLPAREREVELPSPYKGEGQGEGGSAPSRLPAEGRGEGVPLPSALSIYIGGGTPSILRPAHLASILAACRARWDIAPDAEITVEANPGTVSLTGLRAWRDLGVNRLSLGVQSLDDGMLRAIGRVHGAQQARSSYAAARRAGFANISLDFIYGLPGQTLDHWRATLEQALALQPDHLSLYALTLEEHTPMAQRVAAGELALPDDDSLADMYALAEDVLDAAGYLHYEISNWATGEQTTALHNTLYWRRRPYYGFGAGAHAFDGVRRTANVLHPNDYIGCVRNGQSPVAETELITPAMARSETMFLGLRLLHEGVSSAEFLAEHGQPLQIFAPQIDELIGLGLLERAGDRVLLTRRGRLLSNQVFVRFLA